MKKLLLAMLVISVCIALSTGAYAGTATTTLDIRVDVVPACTVSSTGIAFAAYDGTSTLAAPGDVTVTCSEGVQYNIALDRGRNFDGNIRRMSGPPSYFLNYSLYKPDAQDWGDSDYAGSFPGGTSYGPIVATGVQDQHIVDGRLFGGQSVPHSTYSDIVMVTVHY